VCGETHKHGSEREGGKVISRSTLTVAIYSAYFHRVYKAIQVGDNRKAKSLMKLILKSTTARLLAVRQVTQLNAGKKTAGVDGKASLSFEGRFTLSEELKQSNTR
jgi:retron-type reverse transcriptase